MGRFNGAEIMRKRERRDLSHLEGKVVTINDYELIKSNGGVFYAFTVKEESEYYYYSSSSIEEFINMCHEEGENVADYPILIKEKIAMKNGNSYRPIEVQ